MCQYSFLSRSIFFEGNLETAVLDREKLQGESEDLWERFRDDRFLLFFLSSRYRSSDSK